MPCRFNPGLHNPAYKSFRTVTKADLVQFGTDYEAALDAYNRAEEDHRNDPNTEVVLLGSDSVETLERTHSSYFELSERHIDQIIARELAELGLR